MKYFTMLICHFKSAFHDKSPIIRTFVRGKLSRSENCDFTEWFWIPLGTVDTIFLHARIVGMTWT